MTEFTDLVSQSAGHAWLFIPSAILLGALHGLEPGHSKTMMAAFIVAVRGTITQAILLAVSATISHTAIVWMFALVALTWGKNWNAETSEPYFQIGSGVIIVGMAVWMLFRTWRDQQRARITSQSHSHGGDHGHDHHDETKRIDTGHGVVELSVFEDGVPPRFRLKYLDQRGRYIAPSAHEIVTVRTTRDDGTMQTFAFAREGDYLESFDEIPEPHQFNALLSIAHGGHAHDYELKYVEHDHAHGDDHDHGHAGLSPTDPGYEDAHSRAHAKQIREQFTNRSVTTWQVIVFGLTGGLLPCPAAVTVLLLCLQLKRLSLGIVLVFCFSIGLALTLLASGVIAAYGTQHVVKRWKWFDSFTLRAPYFASILIICVGLYVGMRGVLSL